jgi:arylsulfatase A-like enzyme
MFASVQDYQRQGICAMGAHLDAAVHNISQALKANDMWDNTLFIFANDNGEKQTIKAH